MSKSCPRDGLANARFLIIQENTFRPRLTANKYYYYYHHTIMVINVYRNP